MHSQLLNCSRSGYHQFTIGAGKHSKQALQESLCGVAVVNIFINNSAAGRGSTRVKHTGGSELGGLASA